MYNWNGKSNKEREVLFIQILLGRDTSTSSLAQYGEFIPIEGNSSEPDSKLLYYKDIVESVEITSVLEDYPNITDTEVINFTLDDSGYKISGIKEEYGVSSDNTSYASVSTWVEDPVARELTLNTTNRYLWNKSTITLSNGYSDSSYKIISSFIGDSGSIKVTELTEYYAISPYNTYAPELVFGQEVGKWNIEKPIGISIDNRYVWNYNVIRFKDEFNNESTQGGYNNAMVIGDYGNQLREVKFVPNQHESDYDINSNGVIVSTETWWESRGGLGQPVDWNHVKDVTQIQINDVVIIRGIAQVVVPQPNNTSVTVDCTTLINAKVSQISDKINNEYTIRATTLNYVIENAEIVAADISRLEAEIEAVEDVSENLKSQVISLNLTATQALADGVLTKEEQDTFRTQYDNIINEYQDVQNTCTELGWSATPSNNDQYIPEYKDLYDAFVTLCADYSGGTLGYDNVGSLKYVIDPKNTSGQDDDIIGVITNSDGLADIRVIDSQLNGSQGSFTVSFNESTWNSRSDVTNYTNYRFIYDGTSWNQKWLGNSINLSTYGITISGTPVENDYIEIINKEFNQKGKFSVTPTYNSRGITSSTLLANISNFYDKLLAFNNRLNEARRIEYDISPVMSELDLGMSIMNLTISNLGSTLDQAECDSITAQLSYLNSIESIIVNKFDEDWSTNPDASNYVSDYANFISSYNTYKDSITTILSSLGPIRPEYITAYTNASTNLTTDINDLEDYYISSIKSIQNITNTLDDNIDNLATILNSTRTVLFDVFGSDYIVDKTEQQSLKIQIKSIEDTYKDAQSQADALGWSTSTDSHYSTWQAVVTAYNALVKNTTPLGYLYKLANYNSTTGETGFCTVVNYTAGTLVHSDGTSESIPAGSNTQIAYKIDSTYVASTNTALSNFVTACDNLSQAIDAFQENRTENIINTLDTDITNLATILNNTRGTLFNIFSDYVVDKSEQQSVRLQLASLKSLYDNVVSRATSLGWNVQGQQAYSYYNAVVKAYNALASNTYNYDNNSSHTIPDTDTSTGLLIHLRDYSGTNTDTYFCETVLQYTADNTLIDTEGTTQPISGSNNVAYKVYPAYVSKMNAWLDNFISSCNTFDEYVDNYQVLDSLIPQIKIHATNNIFYVDDEGTVLSPINGTITLSIVALSGVSYSNYSWNIEGSTETTSTVTLNLNNYLNYSEIDISCSLTATYGGVSKNVTGLTLVIPKVASNSKFELSSASTTFEINPRKAGDNSFQSITISLVNLGYDIDPLHDGYVWLDSSPNASLNVSETNENKCVLNIPYDNHTDMITVTYLTPSSSGFNIRALSIEITTSGNTTIFTPTDTTVLDGITVNSLVELFTVNVGEIQGTYISGTVTTINLDSNNNPVSIVIDSIDENPCYVASLALKALNIPATTIYFGPFAGNNLSLSDLPGLGFEDINSFIEGDSYLDSTTGLPMYRISEVFSDSWIPFNDSKLSPQFKSKLLSESLYDALQYPTHNSIVALTGFFDGLASINAFIENLMASYLKLGKVLFAGRRKAEVSSTQIDGCMFNITGTTSDSSGHIVSLTYTGGTIDSSNANESVIYRLQGSNNLPDRYYRFNRSIVDSVINTNFNNEQLHTYEGFIEDNITIESDSAPLSKYDFDSNGEMYKGIKLSKGFFMNKLGNFNLSDLFTLYGSIESESLQTINKEISDQTYTSSIVGKEALYSYYDIYISNKSRIQSNLSSTGEISNPWSGSFGSVSDIVNIEYRDNNNTFSSTNFINDRFQARGLSSRSDIHTIRYRGTVSYNYTAPWLHHYIGDYDDRTTIYIRYKAAGSSTWVQKSASSYSDSGSFDVYRGDQVWIQWAGISDQWFNTCSNNTIIKIIYSVIGTAGKSGLNFIRSGGTAYNIPISELSNNSINTSYKYNFDLTYGSYNMKVVNSTTSVFNSNHQVTGWVNVTAYAKGVIPSNNGATLNGVASDFNTYSIVVRERNNDYTGNSAVTTGLRQISGDSTSFNMNLSNGSIPFSSSKYYTDFNISVTLFTQKKSTVTKLLLPKDKYKPQGVALDEEGTDIGSDMGRETVVVGNDSITYYPNWFKDVRAYRVHNAIWNDYVDKLVVNPDLNLIPGKCYIKSGNRYDISNKYCQKGTLGIHSDTYAHSVGNVPETTQLAISVSGYVLAYTDKQYDPGTPLTSGKDGVLTKMHWWSRMIHPERMVGTYLKDEPSNLWFGTVKVNGRNWIKVK